MSVPVQRAPELEISQMGISATCVSCQRSFASFVVTDPIDGQLFEVCELCLPVLGGCRGCPAT